MAHSHLIRCAVFGCKVFHLCAYGFMCPMMTIEFFMVYWWSQSASAFIRLLQCIFFSPSFTQFFNIFQITIFSYVLSFSCFRFNRHCSFTSNKITNFCQSSVKLCFLMSSMTWYNLLKYDYYYHYQYFCSAFHCFIFFHHIYVDSEMPIMDHHEPNHHQTHGIEYFSSQKKQYC